MSIFIYTAKRGPKETVDGEIEAVSQEEAVSKLEEMGLVPVKVAEKRSPAQKSEVRIQKSEDREQKEEKKDFQGSGFRVQGTERKKIPAFGTKVKSRDLDTFTRQLASLMKSSVPLLQALALIAGQTESKAMKDAVNNLAQKIKDGKMLSEAMTAYPRLFNNLYLSMIKAGERSGTLDQVLYRLADHRERDRELRQKIQAAMVYPMLVICVGVATIFVMLTFFLPKLTLVFKGMKQALPLPTRILMGLSNFMSRYWYFFLIAAACAFAVFGRVKRGSKKKALFDMIKLRLPFVQKFTKDAEVARFARSLGILLKNGLPIHESLELAADSLDNDAMKESIARAGKNIIEQGLSLSESFERTKIFPKFTISMISVGEGSGRVVEALEEIANVYEREVDQSIKIMSSLLEPILILTVGAIVGFIVFAMLLPVFNIGMMGR